MSGTFNPFSLQDKTILITGASSGIGRGIAVACSKMGAKIVLNGQNKGRLEETLSLLHDEGHLLLPGDLTDEKDLLSIVDGLPIVDGVVHCAGIGQRRLCKMLSNNDINQVMDVNFKAPVLLQSALLSRKRISKGASVVFIASISSWSPSIGNSVYSASKGAIISYANCLALELAPRKIRVNCISPAMVWTSLIKQDGIDDKQLIEDEKRYPLRRYGTPEDVANLAVYMLSDASAWMTGANVSLTGGILQL